MPTYKRELITPRDAKRILGTNAENNRLPKTGKVPMYARDMKTGRWNSDSGETLKIDVDGRLIDGQNRMLAVILADCAIEFDIAYDVPAAAMLVVDTGAARTAADALKISGTTDRNRISGVIRWSILWDAKVYTGTGGNFNPTVLEIRERYLASPDLYDSAVQRGADCQRLGLGRGGPAGTAHYLFSRIDRELTHQFFDQYISGANLPEDCGPLALRRKMAVRVADRVTRSEELALFVRAWNAWRDEKTLERMTIVRAGKLNNINFPQPH